MIAVTTVPSRSPFRGVLVSLYKISSSLLPATFFRLSPISDIPYKNRATPLSNDKTIVIPIILFSFSLSISLHFVAKKYRTATLNMKSLHADHTK